MAKKQAESMVPFMLGKFGLKNKTLYLLPRNFKPLLKVSGIQEKHLKGIVKLIIAHELTHGLQEQESGIWKTAKSLTKVDAGQAFNACIEGHAVLMADKVGALLKLDEAVLASARLFSSGNIKMKDPLLQLFAKNASMIFQQIYLGGKKFMAFHDKQSGNDKLWAILKKPPQSTKVIYKPETYGKEQVDKIDYKALLVGLEKDFADKKWKVRNIEVGKIQLYSIYAAMSKEDRKKVVSSIERAQAIVATNKAPGEFANVSILRFNKKSDGKVMLSAVEKMVKSNVEKMKKSKTITIKDFKIEKFSLLKSDTAHKISFSIFIGLQTVTQSFYRIHRDKVVIEMMISNLKIEDKTIAKIAEKVFKRYKEAKKQN
jgi:hypothetical protein